MQQKKRLLAFSILPAFFLVKLLSFFPGFIETFYSNGIYPFTSRLLRYTFGWIPFSMGDVLYTILGIYVLRWFFKNFKRIWKDTANWALDVLSAISMFYIAFHVFWGMNYYRLPLHINLGIDYKYTTEELISVTNQLIQKSNITHSKINTNDTLKVRFPYSKTELVKMADNGYENLSEKHPEFTHKTKSTKRSLYSLVLTYMGFSGYLNPFTNEAQVDDMIPLYQHPMTICHEQAHQIGYAAENETNFIGYLATIHNDDIYYQYSGYISGLRYCLNEIYRRDKELYKSILPKINKGILKNYQESYDFWSSYQNPLEPVLKTFYSGFLKVNNQEKGIESYSYVVALLVNYYKDNSIL